MPLPIMATSAVSIAGQGRKESGKSKARICADDLRPERRVRFSLSFFDPLTLLCAFRINGLVNGMSGTKILAPTLLILAWALEIPAQKPPIVVYLAGDSTLAQKTWDKRP